MFVSRRALSGKRFPGNFLTTLFEGGKAGFAIDYSDISTLSKDLAGIDPVTASGQMFRRARDVSGNGHHAVVPEDTYRPTYTEGAQGRYAFGSGVGLVIPGSEADFKFIHDGSAFGLAVLVENDHNGSLNRLVSNAGGDFDSGINIYADERSNLNEFTGGIPKGSTGLLHDLRSDTLNVVYPNVKYTIVINKVSSGGSALTIINGSTKSNEPQNGTPSTADSTYQMGIGLFPNPASYSSFPFKGKYWAAIVREGGFTSTELADIDTYFASISTS